MYFIIWQKYKGLFQLGIMFKVRILLWRIALILMWLWDVTGGTSFVSDIAIFVLKRDVKLQLTNSGGTSWECASVLYETGIKEMANAWSRNEICDLINYSWTAGFALPFSVCVYCYFYFYCAVPRVRFHNKILITNRTWKDHLSVRRQHSLTAVCIKLWTCMNTFFECHHVQDTMGERKRKFLHKFWMLQNQLCMAFNDRATADLELR